MKLVNTGQFRKSLFIDFALNPAPTATYTTPLTLPAGALVTAVYFYLVTNVTVTNNPFIQFGITGHANWYTSSVDLTAFTAPATALVGGAIEGFNPGGVSPLTPASGTPVIMTITGASASYNTGQLVVTFDWTSNPIA